MANNNDAKIEIKVTQDAEKAVKQVNQAFTKLQDQTVNVNIKANKQALTDIQKNKLDVLQLQAKIKLDTKQLDKLKNNGVNVTATVPAKQVVNNQGGAVGGAVAGAVAVGALNTKQDLTSIIEQSENNLKSLNNVVDQSNISLQKLRIQLKQYEDFTKQVSKQIKIAGSTANGFSVPVSPSERLDLAIVNLQKQKELIKRIDNSKSEINGVIKLRNKAVQDLNKLKLEQVKKVDFKGGFEKGVKQFADQKALQIDNAINSVLKTISFGKLGNKTSSPGQVGVLAGKLAGGIASIAVIGTVLNKVADAALKLRQGLKNAQNNAQRTQAIINSLQQIPLAGSFISLGEKLSKLYNYKFFDDLEKAQDASKQLSNRIKQKNKLFQDIQETNKKINQQTKDIQSTLGKGKQQSRKILFANETERLVENLKKRMSDLGNTDQQMQDAQDKLRLSRALLFNSQNRQTLQQDTKTASSKVQGLNNQQLKDNLKTKYQQQIKEIDKSVKQSIDDLYITQQKKDQITNAGQALKLRVKQKYQQQLKDLDNSIKDIVKQTVSNAQEFNLQNSKDLLRLKELKDSILKSELGGNAVTGFDLTKTNQQANLRKKQAQLKYNNSLNELQKEKSIFEKRKNNKQFTEEQILLLEKNFADKRKLIEEKLNSEKQNIDQQNLINIQKLKNQNTKAIEQQTKAVQDAQQAQKKALKAATIQSASTIKSFALAGISKRIDDQEIKQRRKTNEQLVKQTNLLTKISQNAPASFAP